MAVGTGEQEGSGILGHALMGGDCPLVHPQPAGDPAERLLLAQSWRWVSCSQKNSSLEDTCARRRPRTDELCPIFPVLHSPEPPAGSGMDPPVIALAQSPGSAAEAATISPLPVASMRKDASPGDSGCSGTGGFS